MNLYGTSKIDDFLVNHALDVIRSTYGDRCILKSKDLLKFGGSAVVGTSETTIANFATPTNLRETYVSTNAINSLICTDNTFVGDVYVEGHYLDGADRKFTTQTLAATGQTRAALTQPLLRATRAFIDAATGLATPATDLIYVYDNTDGDNGSGVPTTEAAIKLIVDGIENQSEKAATSLSYQDYAIVTGIYAGIEKKSNANAVVRIRSRVGSKVFRTIAPKIHLDADGATEVFIEYKPYLVIPKNSDIELTAEGSTSGITISAGFNSFLALVI